MTAPLPPAPTPAPRSLWQREPVRVVNFAFIVINGLNALLLGIGAYDGGAAAAVTGFITVVQAGTNELFVRQEVVPIRPLEDLAERAAAQAGVPPPAPA